MEPYLYVLMRTDLASLNPGKQCAHAAHAANLFEHDLRKSVNTEVKDLAQQWAEGTGGQFGVTICLGVNENDMRNAVMIANNFADAGKPVLGGLVHDPSYPLQDGVPKDGGAPTFAKIHLIPLDTCAYIFGDKEMVKPFLGHLKLMA